MQIKSEHLMSKNHFLIIRTILLIFVMFIFCSCGRGTTIEKGTNDPVLEIDLLSEAGSKVTRISEFASGIDYIALQTTDNSLIGDVRLKVVKTDNRYYLKNVEGAFDTGILCYDSKGKFLFKLDNQGRGPGEYANIEDFDVTSDNKFLIILSSLDSRIHVYEISESGFTFQRSVVLSSPRPYRVAAVPETDNVFLAIPPWTGDEPTLSLLINISGDTIHFKPNCYKYEMLRKTNYRSSTEILVYSTGDRVCFKETFSDTVFYADADNKFFSPVIIFDSHGTNMTPEMRGSLNPPSNNVNWIANIFETSRYVFYYYGTSYDRYRILYDKKTDTKYKLDIGDESRTLIKDDLSGGPDFEIEFLRGYSSGGRLFSFVDAITLKNYVAGEDFKNAKVIDPKKKEELKKLADSLKETDNPVLVMVTPKE